MLAFHRRDQIREQSASVRNWENLSKPIMERNFNKHESELGWWRAQAVNQIAHRELRALGYDVPKASPIHKAGAQVLDVSTEGFGLAWKAARGYLPKAVELLDRGKRRRNVGRIAAELEARQRPRWPRER